MSAEPVQNPRPRSWRLQESGLIVVIIVLGALTYKLTLLQDIRAAIDSGKSEFTVFGEFKLFGKRQDDIRRSEAGLDFGPRFVELARSVYRQNDKRAALKRKINELLGSRIIEEKSYPKLPPAEARTERAAKR